MVKKSLSPEVRRRRVFRDMTAATREVAKKTQTRLRRANLHELRTRHDIGRMLADITRNPAAYEQDAVRRLAEYTAIPGGVRALVEMRVLAREFTPYEVVQEGRKPTAAGDFVSYGHFRELMRVRNRKRQRELLERVRCEGLSVMQLKREITADQRQGGPIMPSSG